MPLKDKLNQYELDSVLAILRSKALPLEKLKSKTIATLLKIIGLYVERDNPYGGKSPIPYRVKDLFLSV